MTGPIRPAPAWPGGFSAAASALRALERRQEIVANNLANTSTDGFKAQRAFARLMADATGAMAPVTEAAPDLRPGTVRETGRALDVAIEREGFLVVATPGGERLVRGGALRIDARHQLVTTAGDPVLGERGAIRVPTFARSIAIGGDGTVRADGVTLDRMRVENVAPGSPLTPEGDGRWIAGEGRQVVPGGERLIRAGALEDSNAEPVSSMVDMLDLQRSYALVERALRVLDEVHETAATRLAKPL